jgi:hypothetical protein
MTIAILYEFSATPASKHRSHDQNGARASLMDVHYMGRMMYRSIRSSEFETVAFQLNRQIFDQNCSQLSRALNALP